MIAIPMPEVRYTTYNASAIRAMEGEFPTLRTGLPCGEKNGPAVALAGAGLSISAGLSMGGILGGLMIAGGVLGGLGAITGNKTLSTIGMVAGVAGSFMSPTGSFINPFTEGFGSSAAGSGLDSVFSSISDFLGSTPSLPDVVPAYDPTALATAGAESAKAAGTSAIKNALMPGEDSAMGSIFDTFKGNAGLLNVVGGAAEAYMNQPKLEADIKASNAQTRLMDARTASEQQQQGLLAQRQSNLQFQNTGNMPTVNQNAQPFEQAPGATPGKYAVVVNGQVQYLDASQYAQLQQQKQAGLIQQGTA